MHEVKTIRCLIADDEPPAREIIHRYIQELPMLQLVGECSNAIQVMSILQQQAVDLIFLDIKMPQLKGNELLKILKNPPKVIFTTAHSEYALEGYELDVVDYLLKPIQFDRFLKAVHKAFQLSDIHAASDAFLPPAESGQKAFVYFRVDRKMVKVHLSDILYIESQKDYIKVFTTNGVLVTKQSITSAEAMLPEKHFMRIHRSFIVSLPKIKSFTHELVEVEKMELPIGKLFRNSVLRRLG
ncbi:MAG: response regulator transcription factor [Flavisolibacter sp.]|nr:response regulator transcription factor [Flavisolibacter sp.]